MAHPAIPVARSGSLADYILALEHRLRRLVSEDCLDRILTIARRFPPWLHCGFECSLQAADQSLDFLVLAYDRSLDDSLPGLDPTTDLADLVEAEPIWRRIQSLCLSCTTPGTLLGDGLTDIWWEFDMDQGRPMSLLPNVFIGTRAVPAGPELSAVRAAGAHYHQVMDEALTMLVSPTQLSGALAMARVCYERMAGKAVGFEIGVMLARETRFLRLFMRNVPKSRIEECLVALGWSGPLGSVDELSGLLDAAECVGLDIDVGEATVAPKVGIELGFGRRIWHAQANNHEKWRRLFDALIASGLCSVEKREALVTWGGGCRLNTDDDLQWKGLRLKDYPIYRAVSHVKIVIDPARPLSAKAYFGFIS
jgi:hypothetical protein